MTAAMIAPHAILRDEPAARWLLRRVRELLAPDGEILLELEPPGYAKKRQRVRFEIDGAVGPWFDSHRLARLARVRASPRARQPVGAAAGLHDRNPHRAGNRVGSDRDLDSRPLPAPTRGATPKPAAQKRQRP